MPKTLLMDDLKKKRAEARRKGGFKTSARNPLFATTPASDKSSLHLMPERLFG
jgi:hypothetical protein